MLGDERGTEMEYYTLIHGESEPEQITKEEARHYLACCYYEKFVDDIINNDKFFKLHTPVRMVWTKSLSGKVPDAEGVFE